MKTIQFDKKNIIREYSKGMESTIYLYKRDSDVVILKKFNKEIKYGDRIDIVPESTFENKRKKLEIISEDSIFENEVKVLDLVYDNDEFIGYTMELIELEKFDFFSKKKKKIFTLQKLKEKIEKFNENGIYIGDFNTNNIFIDENSIKLVDLDNIKICDLDFDLKNTFQHLYFNKCKNIDNIDNYSFNLFTVSVFYRVLNPYIWDNIDEKGLPRILNTRENRKLIEDMRNISDKGYQKRYLIDNMKKF